MIKFTLPLKQTQLVFSNLAAIINEKQIMAVLDCAKFVCKNGSLTIGATNLRIGYFEVFSNIETEDFEFLVDATLLNNFVKSVTSETNEVYFSLKENKLTVFSKANAKINLNIVSSENYPENVFEFPSIKEVGFEINTESFFRILYSVSGAAAKPDDTREILKLIRLKNLGDFLEAVCTDSYRVYKYREPVYTKEKIAFNFPADLVKNVINIFSDDVEQLMIYDTEKIIYISGNNRLVKISKITGDYPNVDGIFSLKLDYVLTVNSSDFQELVKLANVVIKDNEYKYFNFRYLGGKLYISSIAEEKADLDSFLDCNSNFPEGFTLKINSNYLLEVLKMLKGVSENLVISTDTKGSFLRFEIVDKSFDFVAMLACMKN